MAGELQLLSVSLCWTGVQWPKVDTLEDSLSYGQLHRSPQMQFAFTGELSQGHQASPTPSFQLASVGWLQRSWPGADACMCAEQEGLGAASFLERRPCQRDSLASTASWGHSLKLTVHSPVQSNCPGAPVGAVARPTRGPAWPSLTMWQAWMAAHSRASFQCCLPRSQMLPLEKNCFTI